jgi:hypothetical protein
MTFEIVFVPRNRVDEDQDFERETKVFHIAGGWMCGVGLYDLLRVWLENISQFPEIDAALWTKYKKLMMVLSSWDKVAEQPDLLSKIDPLKDNPMKPILEALCQGLKGHLSYQQWLSLDTAALAEIGTYALRHADFYLAGATTQIMHVIDSLPWLISNTKVEGKTAQTIIPTGVFSYQDLVSIVKDLLTIGHFINGDDKTTIIEEELFEYIGRRGLNGWTAAVEYPSQSVSTRLYFEYVLQTQGDPDTTYRVISSLN